MLARAARALSCSSGTGTVPIGMRGRGCAEQTASSNRPYVRCPRRPLPLGNVHLYTYGAEVARTQRPAKAGSQETRWTRLSIGKPLLEGLRGVPQCGLNMELSFSTKALRAICVEPDRAVSQYSSAVAASLRSRVADLRAAGSVADLVAGRPATLEAGEPALLIALAEGYVLRCRPNHASLHRTSLGSIDWSRVRRIHLVAIEEQD
jgi:proteic killer suppression protein